jgi:hypothetical protein
VADAAGQADRLNAQGNFRDYYRRVLTGHESRLWRHQNPDMATWRRKVIIEETATACCLEARPESGYFWGTLSIQIPERWIGSELVDVLPGGFDVWWKRYEIQ